MSLSRALSYQNAIEGVTRESLSPFLCPPTAVHKTHCGNFSQIVGLLSVFLVGEGRIQATSGRRAGVPRDDLQLPCVVTPTQRLEGTW